MMNKNSDIMNPVKISGESSILQSSSPDPGVVQVELLTE